MSKAVEQIKEKLNILDIIGTYVKLVKAGSGYKGKCPFHNEKTPSFSVSPDRGFYYCFGCGAKGDIFTFVEQIEGLDFKGALIELADRAGVKLFKDDVRQREDSTSESKDGLYETLEIAADYFQDNLKRRGDALEYLKRRGLDDASVANWRIGFAEDSWRSLQAYLKSKKIPEKLAVDAGLVKQSDNATYDRFRSRVMFPIFDSAGRVVGFSGRHFDAEIAGGKGANADKSEPVSSKEEADKPKTEEPKYLNTPETAVFKKSEILYGYNRAKTIIKKYDFSIIVEGQMDLVLTHQAGYQNTVATSGTALTDSHLKILNRLSKRVVFAFDGDSAGLKAALRAAAMAVSMGMDVKICPLPLGTDPADLVRQNPILLKNAVAASKNVVDFLSDAVFSSGKKGRKLIDAVTADILPFVKSVPNKIEQSQYVSKLGERLGVGQEAVYEELAKVSSYETSGAKNAVTAVSREPSTRGGQLRRILRGLVLWKESLHDDEFLSKIKKQADSLLKEDDDAANIKEELIFEAEKFYGDQITVNEALSLIKDLEREMLKEDAAILARQLKESETAGDKDRAAKLLESIHEISRRIDKLENKAVESINNKSK
ncbi:MAG: hypothetical protein A3G59_02400 [Candidatus Taylorbacteria bacterium RIFCSPLOWO2_12_FULL_47_20]|uniref:DNA primase n=1 Tax=Candidatus Taylorbacteria bacterium RIFCSPLOWO2_12_FULL_47_20 TaxID=1802335 RepID=A0A1G2PAA1_9BACT|nr:MAG: hypothetical protein A3G59_02400 [Candidatus Taylorbacteria bacterium RIFCSPLOWO2_12_FULL_47_20]